MTAYDLAQLRHAFGHFAFGRPAAGMEVLHSVIAREERKSQLPLGTVVEKIKGSSWHGKIVGSYSTTLTPEGYAVESDREPGSVQIYPVAALRRIFPDG